MTRNVTFKKGIRYMQQLCSSVNLIHAENTFVSAPIPSSKIKETNDFNLYLYNCLGL